jgi:MinD-like ATPase involved in chromosome partitioning or flagellar assembly
MTPEQQANFNRYEELKEIVKQAEKEIKTLAPLILPLVPEDKELLTQKGYFYVQKRPTWTFSEELQEFGETLKKKEEEEKAKGIATVEYKGTLYYKSGRPEPREE